MSEFAGLALAPGATLTDGLVVGEVLRRTARCLVYRGRDEEHGLDLAIEEYFPRNLAVRRDDGSVGVAVGGFGGQAYTAGLERFVDETRRWARIAGAAGLPQLREALQGGGTAYRVTVLLDGIWLEEFLARRPEGLPRAAALRIVGPVLDALEAAHSVGLAHGAVGPGTVVLCRSGAVALLDFEGVGGPADDVQAAGALLARLVRGAAEADLEAHEREALAVVRGFRPGVRLETVADLRRALAGEPIAETPASVPERAPLPGDDGKTRLMTAPPPPPVSPAPPSATAPEATRLMMPSDFARPASAPAAAPIEEAAPPPPAPARGSVEKTRLLFSFEPPPARPAPSRPSEPPDPDQILTRILEP